MIFYEFFSTFSELKNYKYYIIYIHDTSLYNEYKIRFPYSFESGSLESLLGFTKGYNNSLRAYPHFFLSPFYRLVFYS